VACWLVVISIFLVSITCLIGHTQGTPVPKWRQKAVYYGTSPLFRLLIFVVGIVWVDKDNKKKVDYSKYLGPDWKPTYKGAGIQVSNH
jgi:hypothetical protein